MYALFQSVIENDRAAVVICNPEHLIVYMNPAAEKQYQKAGGKALIGQSLLKCHNERSNEIILKVVAWFRESRYNNMIYTYHNEAKNKDVYMVALRDSYGNLIGYYEKHEYRNVETAPICDFSQSLI